METNSLYIKGILKYQNIETGFWTIVEKTGKVFRILNPDIELYKDDLIVEAEIEIDENNMSVFMMGIPIKIIKIIID